jgi:hypothetical protein
MSKFPHDFSVQSVSAQGVPILNCAHPGCAVIWWPERRQPTSACPGAMLLTISAHVLAEVRARVDELDGQHGCEAGAARAYERGRFEVVTEQMWKALGLPTLAEQEAAVAPTPQPVGSGS